MILTAISTEAGMAAQHFRVVGRNAVIGRGADCDWTLPDPSRQLSKRHCQMAGAGADWRVTDLSSNGMTVNDRTITPGVSHGLQNGDRLGMGSYEITVSLEDAATRTGAGFSSAGYAEAEPFGDGHAGGRMIGDPFVSPGAETITDPFNVALPPFFEDRPEPAGRGPTGGSAGDDVSDLHRPFEPPRPDHLLLPDDWDTPLHGDAPPSAAPAPGSEPVSHPSEATPYKDGLSVARPEPAPEPSAAAAPAPDRPSGLSADGHDTANVPRAAAVQADGPGNMLDQAATDDAALRAFSAFARGAGLDGMPQDAPAEALEKLGRAFRAYVTGLRRLLIARATVKGEFRIDRTMIRPFGNNPIKFATDDNDAMAALLGIGRQVGMTAEQAVSDSIRDVRTHELALTEAFQHGIRQLVAEMSPEQVSADLQPGAFDMVPVLRNSRLWKTYEARHAKMLGSLDNSFDSVFGQAFARGYEAALSALGDTEPDDAPARGGRPA